MKYLAYNNHINIFNVVVLVVVLLTLNMTKLSDSIIMAKVVKEWIFHKIEGDSHPLRLRTSGIFSKSDYLL